MNSTLFKDLRNLKLSGIAKTLEVRNEQAIKEKLSYMEFLELLIEDELANRKDNSYKKRFQKAHFPFSKTLEEYDFNFQPTLNRQEIYNLATCEFIRKKENVVFIGPPGTGNYRKLLFMERNKRIFFFYKIDAFISFHNTSE